MKKTFLKLSRHLSTKTKGRTVFVFFLGVICTISFIVVLDKVAPVVQAQSYFSSRDEYKEIKGDLKTIEKSFALLLENYVDEVPLQTLFEGAMKGLFESVDDPYTQYLTPKDLDNLQNTTNGRFGGIGLYISGAIKKDDDLVGKDAYVRVIAPIEGTPAYKAGVHSGDLIYEIEGESAYGLTSEEVSNLLKGKEGTDVNVVFLRDDDIKLNVKLTRAVIEIPTIKSIALPDNTTGYIKIIQFTPYTAERFKEALLDFDEQGMQNLIIDVRGNPGGLLDSVLELLDYFVPANKVLVTTQARQKNANQEFKSKTPPLLSQNPRIAVLIDGGSASASEILTGVLADYNIAETWGEKTFGKGVVQQVIPIDDSVVKMTTSRYYLPEGETIDKLGIEPMHPIESKKLSDNDIEDYKVIIENNLIANFVKENPAPNASQINAFIQGLRTKEKLQLDDRSLQILIRNEVNRTLDDPPIYDLEFDDTLKATYESFQ